jgi:hypothetical protein
MRRTLEGALKCAFRDLRLELLTPAHKSRLLKAPQTLQKTPTLHAKAIKNQTATQKTTHRHPLLATAVEETKPNQTKPNQEQKRTKSKSQKEKKCLKGENGEDYYVKRTSWLLIPRTVTKKRKKRSSGSCTWSCASQKRAANIASPEP